MPATKSLRDATHGHAVAQVDGSQPGINPLAGNMGYGDVRMNAEATQVITMGSFGGTDSFKIRYRPQGTGDVQDTAAFVRGSNATAAAIQTALRAFTDFDDGCTVAGTTDEGPFTITFVNNLNVGLPLLELVSLSGCSGHVTRTAPTYIDATGHVLAGTAGDGTVFVAANQTASLPGESNMVAVDVPLGHSLENGETAGVALPPVTIDSAVGGVGQVVILGTEEGVATSAVVMYVIRNKTTGAMFTTVTEDADADCTITGLDAGEYVLYGYTQTLIAADPDPESARVSRASPPEHFTVT
jgi:hypothetical protein